MGGFAGDNTGDVTFTSSRVVTDLVAVETAVLVVRASLCARAAASPLGLWGVLDFL